MKTVTIRRATQADVPTVVDLWTEAAGWLRDRGSDQWQYPIKMDNGRNAIAGGPLPAVSVERSHLFPRLASGGVQSWALRC